MSTSTDNPNAFLAWRPGTTAAYFGYSKQEVCDYLAAELDTTWDDLASVGWRVDAFSPPEHTVQTGVLLTEATAPEANPA